MRCEYGFCIVCDKEIAPACGYCDTRKPGPDYTEVEMIWSNGSRMKMACCLDCSKDKIWTASKQELSEAVWKAWEKMGGHYDKGVVLV